MSNPDNRRDNKPRNLTRRSFLGRSAGAVSLYGAAISARSAPARGANETIRVGLIGCGSRGPYLGFVFQSQPNVQVVAVCDVYRKHREHAAELVSRLGAKARLYNDFRELLEQADIDAVVIATNIHWHVIPAIAACAAGKDVYLEKPVGAAVYEGRAAINAAKRSGRIVQMGMQQHSWAHYVEAAEVIQSGKLGEISEVHVWDVRKMPLGAPPDSDPPEGLDWDFWLGPAPKVPYNPNRQFQHDWFFDYSGGWQLAWGAHHMGIVHEVMGVRGPVSVTAAGGKYAFAEDNREWPDTFDGACAYPAGPVAKQGFLLRYMCRTGSGIPIHGRSNGKAFHGSGGVLVLNRQGYELYTEKQDWGQEPRPDRVVVSAKREHEVVGDHVAAFLRCVRERGRPVVDLESGHLASNPGHLMNIAWRLGRRIEWDVESEKVRDDAQAGRLLSRQYRTPWTLPS
jgi:predicted dehydrogenase